MSRFSVPVGSDLGSSGGVPGASEGGASPVRLRCLAGGAVADDLVESAARAQKLTASATRDLGVLLRPCVTMPMTPELGERLSRYCVAHEVAEADLGHVLRACKWLLREASASDASMDDLQSDARALFGEGLVERLSAEYDALRPGLRRELIIDALLKHGTVLDDIDWRIDVVAADRHAPRLGTSIALVSLAYRNAQRSERLTLQLTSEQLGRLQTIFAALAQKTQHIAQ